MSRPSRFLIVLLVALALGCGEAAHAASAAAPPAAAADADEHAGGLNISVNVGGSGSEGRLSDVVQILVFLTFLSLIPAMILTMTSFTRVVIVLSFVRRAMSLQQLPPNQILIGMSLFMTVYIMAPVLGEVNARAIQPCVNGTISQKEALREGLIPLRGFMLKQTRQKDLALFVRMTRLPRPKRPEDVPTHVLIPAFVTSEIKTAFQMGFFVFLPMLILDMVIATLLTSMGMFMLPPAMVSVPFKILLFVLVDGWHLVIGSVARSFV